MTFRGLAMCALAIFLSGSVFTAITGLIWPEHYPPWAQQVSDAWFLAGLLVLGSAAFRLWRKDRA